MPSSLLSLERPRFTPANLLPLPSPFEPAPSRLPLTPKKVRFKVHLLPVQEHRSVPYTTPSRIALSGRRTLPQPIFQRLTVHSYQLAPDDPHQTVAPFPLPLDGPSSLSPTL